MPDRLNMFHLSNGVVRPQIRLQVPTEEVKPGSGNDIVEGNYQRRRRERPLETKERRLTLESSVSKATVTKIQPMGRGLLSRSFRASD